MQGLNKTKAALQGRQCQNTYINHNQISISAGTITRVAEMQLGQEMNCGYKLTAPLAQLIRDTRKSAHTGNSTYLKSLATWWVCPKLDRPQPIDLCEILQCRESTPMADTLSRNSGLAAGGIPPSKQNHRAIVQPFGSMPCRTNSARAKAFNQLPRLTPSLLAASFICWRSSGAIRIWKVGERPSPLGVLSLLMVDMYVRNPVVWILLCTYVITTCLQKATPRTVGAVPRRLTKPLYEVTIMADIQSTQTHPKYQYRFLALHRSDRSAAPCRLSVEAFTEKEARQVLSAHFILSLAARLPVSEVRHA